MNHINIDKLTELKTLCKTYDVKTMYVFGSVCTNRFNDRSDIDFLITFDNLSVEQYTDNYFDLYYQLQRLFGRKIDLLTDRALSNPYFIESVEESKQLIYAA
jgi:predicted nucleotidyltransferase